MGKRQVVQGGFGKTILGVMAVCWAAVLCFLLFASHVSAYGEEADGSASMAFAGGSAPVELVLADSELSESKVKPDTFFEWPGQDELLIFDMDYLDLVYDEKEVTLSSLFEAIDGNSNLSAKFKDLLREYCMALVENYPNVELRVLYENLKTLKIVEVSPEAIAEISRSGSLGCYHRVENTVYLLDYYTYERGMWQYQTFFHEMSHCTRTKTLEVDGKEVKVQFEGFGFTNNMTAEALNSLFAVSLFEDKEDSISYQLQSNYFTVMLECMDNYGLSDYIQHSSSYFAAKLNEHNGDGRAVAVLELIQDQYDEYHGNKGGEIDGEDVVTHDIADDSEYYPIYDYLARMYYAKHVRPWMSEGEIRSIADDLVGIVGHNVPDQYHVTLQRFYDDLEAYCDAMGM